MSMSLSQEFHYTEGSIKEIMRKQKSSPFMMLLSLLIVLFMDCSLVQGMMVAPPTTPMSKKVSRRRPNNPHTLQRCRTNTHLFATNNHKMDETTNRRDFVKQSLAGTVTAVVASSSSTNTFFAANAAQQQQQEEESTTKALPLWVTELDSKNVKWNTNNDNDKVQWNQLRYGTSSLEGQSRRQGPPMITTSTSTSSSTPFPSWMEGTWLVSYKFSKATFPQGRDKLNLRIAGAGLGTCVALPNVGYNPSPLTCRYVRNTKSRTTNNSSNHEEAVTVYEDLAYNIPRRFEAFWPESKVSSIQTGGDDDDHNNNRLLTPKCFVTGEGCTLEQNPLLHDVPLSRAAFDFTGPTRRGGYLSQSIDTTQVGGDSYYIHQNTQTKQPQPQFTAYRQYAQFNVNQDLQTFYKELVSLNIPPCAVDESKTSSCKEEMEEITGRIRVAAFLPPSEAMALSSPSSSSSSSTSQVPYDNTMALAIYDYKIKMKPISEEEASMV